MPEADKYYIKRCLDGHPDDYQHLVRRYQGPLLAHLFGRLGNRDSAEEAAQEVFVRCYFKLPKLKKQTSFFAWMLGVANNIAKEQIRNTKRERQTREELSDVNRETKVGYDWPLARTIAKLDNYYRELILLRYYGGHDCKEISQMMNIPIGTVTKTLSRAYAQLRELLAKEEAIAESEVQL